MTRTQLSAADFEARARRIEWLLCDVDGVLTDGRVWYGDDGEPWVAFDIKDGLALKLAQRGGLKVGILSGRSSSAVARRARGLGLDSVVAGREDKGPAFREWLAETGVESVRVAYVGDDLLDLPVAAACGLSFAPRDAAIELRDAVDRVLEHDGGRGAVREVVRSLLQARGVWDRLVDSLANS
jgi:3-deoxy-D-manno-octulosonate 8-phosphate phosphatase (KDO 8-P phosphatase)